jgi:hypothetical protein
MKIWTLKTECERLSTFQAPMNGLQKTHTRKKSLRDSSEGSAAIQNTSAGRGNRPTQPTDELGTNALADTVSQQSIPNALHAREDRNEECQQANCDKQNFRIKLAVGFVRCGCECRGRRENMSGSGHIQFSNRQ